MFVRLPAQTHSVFVHNSGGLTAKFVASTLVKYEPSPACGGYQRIGIILYRGTPNAVHG